ncbi:hypothetical protein DL93DRAFT_2086327 [Clavulina sp. PMI_390]|nr:hypothetical protein DL93DRAFT_2086327 [Clavulina sp. PMI_390]
MDRSTSPAPELRAPSPAPSLRVIPSIRSRTSTTGSHSTVYSLPPAIETLPSIPSRSSSIRSASSPRSSTHLLPPRAADDASIISGDDVLGGGSALSRSSSLRRTSSFDDLSRDFRSAVSRASSGLGVTSAPSAGAPVTISSGAVSPRGRENLIGTPPSARRSRLSGSRSVSGSDSGSSYQSISSLAPPGTAITGLSRTQQDGSTTGYGDNFTSPTFTSGTIFGRRGTAYSSASGSGSDAGRTFDGTYDPLRDSFRTSGDLSTSRQPLLAPSESEPSRGSYASTLTRTSAIRRTPSGARPRTLSTPSSSGEFFTAPEGTSGQVTARQSMRSSYTEGLQDYATASAGDTERPRSASDLSSRSRSRTPTRGTYRTGSSPGISGGGDYELYDSETFTGLTPSGSFLSPGTQADSLLSQPLRTVFTEERTTTTRYYGPQSPPGSDYRTATSGTSSYESASSGSSSSGSTRYFSAAGSPKHPTQYFTPTSGPYSFLSAKSSSEQEFVTASNGGSTEFFTAPAGSPLLPRTPSPLSQASIPTIPSESRHSPAGSTLWLSSPYTLSTEERRSLSSPGRTPSSAYLASPPSLVGSIPAGIPSSTPTGSSTDLPLSSSLTPASWRMRRDDGSLTPTAESSSLTPSAPSISLPDIPASSYGASTPSIGSSGLSVREAPSVRGHSLLSSPSSVSSASLYAGSLEHLRSPMSAPSVAVTDTPSSPLTRWTLSTLIPERDLGPEPSISSPSIEDTLSSPETSSVSSLTPTSVPVASSISLESGGLTFPQSPSSLRDTSPLDVTTASPSSITPTEVTPRAPSIPLSAPTFVSPSSITPSSPSSLFTAPVLAPPSAPSVVETIPAPPPTVIESVPVPLPVLDPVPAIVTVPPPSVVESPPVPPPSAEDDTWATETDNTYESSILRPSPSVRSMALPEPVNDSFESSFLRPTESAQSDPAGPQWRIEAVPASPSISLSLRSQDVRRPPPIEVVVSGESPLSSPASSDITVVCCILI